MIRLRFDPRPRYQRRFECFGAWTRLLGVNVARWGERFPRSSPALAGRAVTAQSSRTFRIFVSSTFSDLKAERNMLLD